MPIFNWNGDSFRRQIRDEVAARLERAGAEGVRVARELVPVATGRTRNAIGSTFDRSTLTLRIEADVKWALFLELGTSRAPARPFLRPALDAVGRAFGGGTGGGSTSPSPGMPARGRARRGRRKV